MEIDKTPLRPGLSYPLRPSVFVAHVAAGGVRTPIVLHQRTENWWTSGVLFRADFYPPARPGVRSEKGETLHVTCRSVPSRENQRARAYLEQDVIPGFVVWIKHLEQLPDNATMKRGKPSFTREWEPP